MAPMESDKPVRVESPRVVRHRKGIARILGFGALGMLIATLLILFVLPSIVAREALPAAAAFSLLTSVGLALGAVVTRLARFGGAATLSVTGENLSIRRGTRRTRIPLARLAQGKVSPVDHEIEIDLVGGDRLLATVSPAQGRRLLRAMGLDASRRTLRARLGDSTFPDALALLVGWIPIAPVVGMIVTVAPWIAPVSVFLFLGLYALLFAAVRALFGPAEVKIGTDGVVIHQALRDTFVPYEALDTIHIDAMGIRFVHVGGKSQRAKGRQMSVPQQRELQARLNEALTTWRAGEGEGVGLGKLDRGGRSLPAWRAALRGLGDHAESYREVALSREAILRVLGSPAAPAERRLAAAMALAAGGDAEGREKIRIAAEASANPHVRIALEKVAEGVEDDAAVEEAIAEDEALRARA
jgi:hypothetical protein